MDIKKASEQGIFKYDSRVLKYVEVKEREMYEIPTDISYIRRHSDCPLSRAIERAKQGESRIYALHSNEYHSIAIYEVDDYDAVLKAFGLAASDHRHHIVWKYSSYETGDKIARVEINFKCGCVLNCETKRTIAKELMEQQGIRLVLSSVRSFNESPVCDVNVYRCDIKDKSNELK